MFAIHHGLTALDRVMSQRRGHGLLAPLDRDSPREGPVAIEVLGVDASLPPSMRDDVTSGA